MRASILPLFFAAAWCSASSAADGNRLAYLDESDPYYVSRSFPKLITPQWVGEEGVEAVVVLAIDDMRGHEKWEAYLRPILERLKQIDGRAPVSIMTCKIDPREPHLQKWLKEGVSLEVHTVDHPCPLLKDGDFAKAKDTYDRCIEQMNAIPNNRAVAFRMPCCDSRNTPSPRFYAEIFNSTTPAGQFLQIDSSVFNILTSDDPELPRELVLDKDGKERFRKYLPFESFVNTIENYPYPYVIGRKCWEFPCVVPSDWEAQNLHKPNNPETVEDLKRVLDCIVAKQGVFNFVFHPHGWIRNDQVVEFIDHAVKKHGRKVKFLTFREALDRINKNLLDGEPLRDSEGEDNNVRVVDVDNNGYVDVLICNQRKYENWLWLSKPPSWTPWAPKPRSWTRVTLPYIEQRRVIDRVDRFGIVRANGLPSIFRTDFSSGYAAFFDELFDTWRQESQTQIARLPLAGGGYRAPIMPISVLFRDIDGDGICELIHHDSRKDWQPPPNGVYRYAPNGAGWLPLPFKLPEETEITDSQDRPAGLRLFDLDEDGYLDVVFSNEVRYSIHLFESMEKGWSRKVLEGKRGDPNAKLTLPMISRNGTNNGAWFHSGHLWVQNEDTARLPDLVDRRSIDELLKDVMPGPKTPAASLKAIKARPGFRVELMAAEPLTMDPVAFAWGPDGKLWVVEMGDYPSGIDGKGKPGGVVRFLEDTDGDGRYDKSTVFLEGLGFPTGIAPWRSGVLVTAAPDIFYAEDTDGDGRADKREVLFTGFGEGNQQHRVNGLKWGLDGWLHCANGDSGGKVKSLKTGEEFDIRGRDFRIRPDEGLLDPQTGQSQYGRNRDDWDNWFGCTNSRPMFHFALADHYLRRNPLVAAPDSRVNVSVVPGAAPVFPRSRTLARFNDLNAANRFTSANSAMVYRDDLFGPEFETSTFVSEPVHNLVHREVMNADGLTFTSRRVQSEQTSEFLASTDNWFRPAMLQTGPDGALWVADMYRLVIEHPQWIPQEWQQRLDLRAGADKGRIYRVFPVGKQPRPIPRLDKLSTEQLVAALASPSGWQRDTAQQLLTWRQDKSAVPLLEKLATQSARPQCRVQSLCTLDGLAALKPDIIVTALTDKHPGVRRHAVRLSERLLDKSPLLTAVWLIEDDLDPQVQLQLAYTLGEWKSSRAGAVLGRLALRHRDERFLTAAILSSTNETNLSEMLSTVLAAKGDAVPAATIIEPLVGMAAAWNDANAIRRSLERLTIKDGETFADWQLTALAGVLEAIERQKVVFINAGTASTKLNEALAFAALQVADDSAPESTRVAAVRLLACRAEQGTRHVDAIQPLLAPRVSGAIQAAAVAALGRIAPESLPDLLTAGWRGHGPALRAQILDLLLSREAWTEALLAKIESKQVAAADIDATRRQRLLQLKNQSLRERAQESLAGSIDANRQKVIDQYSSVLTMAGNAEAGAALFAKRCAVCHQLRGAGHAVGPDLAALTDNSPLFLLTAILDPNRAVEAKFLDYVAINDSGETFTGMLANETGNSITLVGQEGKQKTILRTELETLQSTGKSLMPEGVEKDVSPQDLANVIAYLRAVGPRKTFPNNKPQLVAAESDGSLRLLAIHAEIYGSTLVLEKLYKNLGYWSSANDRAAWAIEAPRSGKYAVRLRYACADSSAGNAYRLEAGSQSLVGKIIGTGSWDNYRELSCGEIELAAGRQQVTLRSEGPIKGALLDLESIELRPVK